MTEKCAKCSQVIVLVKSKLTRKNNWKHQNPFNPKLGRDWSYDPETYCQRAEKQGNVKHGTE